MVFVRFTSGSALQTRVAAAELRSQHTRIDKRTCTRWPPSAAGCIVAFGAQSFYAYLTRAVKIPLRTYHSHAAHCVLSQKTIVAFPSRTKRESAKLGLASCATQRHSALTGLGNAAHRFASLALTTLPTEADNEYAEKNVRGEVRQSR